MTTLKDQYEPYNPKAETSLSFFQRAKGLFIKSKEQEEPAKDQKSFWNPESLTDSLNEKIMGAQDKAEAYKMGALLLLIGGVVIFISTFYLPFIAIMPHKFTSMFSFGSIILMMALATMLGTKKFFKTLFSKKNIFYATCYMVSLIAS